MTEQHDLDGVMVLQLLSVPFPTTDVVFWLPDILIRSQLASILA